jgi:hypothetical protein
MVDQTLPTQQPGASVCPWCSASLTPGVATCPSCGAILTSEGDPDLPGVTAVDQAVLRGEKKQSPSRNRLLSWISGEYPDAAPEVGDAQALAPPDPDVRREITRLALEAEVANLQAEADSILSEAAVEGRVIEVPEGINPFVPGGATDWDTGTESDAAHDDAAPAAEDASPTADGGPDAAVPTATEGGVDENAPPV